MFHYSLKKLFLLIVLACVFIDTAAQLPALIPYRKANKWGLANDKKKIIIEPVYDSIVSYSEGRASFLKDGKWGSLDEKGNVVIEPTYGHSLYFNKGLAKITIQKDSIDLFGFVNDKGTVVIEPKFDLIYQSGSQIIGRISVKRTRYLTDRFYGFWDARGKEILPPLYQSIGTFNSGIAKVEKDRKYGYIDSTGKWIIGLDNTYSSLEPFSNGLGLTQRIEPKVIRSSYEYIDITGKVAHNGKQYRIADPYIGGVAKVFVKNENDESTTRMFIDVTGKELNIVLKGDYFIDRLVENGFLIKKPVYPAGYVAGLAGNEDYKHATHYLVGFMDHKGQIKEAPMYERISILNTRFLMGKLNGKWALINTKAQNATSQPVLYDTILLTWNGYLKLRKDKKWGCADTSGKILLPLIYDTIVSIDKATISLVMKGRYGCVDFTGKTLVPFKYDNIGAMENGVVLFMSGNKLGIVNNKGKELVPPKYEPRSFRSYTGATVYYGMTFSKGIALVSYKGRSGYVDNTGKEYWED